MCAADRSIPAVESIAGDEAAAAELDRLARLMEQQAILEKVPVQYRTYIFARTFFAFLNEKVFTETYFLLYKVGTGPVFDIFYHSFIDLLFSFDIGL